MMKIIIIFHLIILLMTCASHNSRTQLQAKYKFDDFSKLLELEKEFYINKDVNTNFKLDSIFGEHALYHKVLIKKLKEKNILLYFNKGFLIEDFTLHQKRSGDKLLDLNYGAIVYFEDSYNKSFSYIEISENKKKTNFFRIKLDSAKVNLISNWMSTKTTLKRVNSINIYNNSIEQYLFITKISENESFCQMVVNPLWFTMLYPTNNGESEDVFKVLSQISKLYFITGKGAPF